MNEQARSNGPPEALGEGTGRSLAQNDFEGYCALVEAVDFGKELPDAIYVHRAGWRRLPAALRGELERALTEHKIPRRRWTLCKLFKRDHKVSFLEYPDFATDPYPCLAQSHLVDLGKGTCNRTDFSRSSNPPILHRREAFLPPGDRRRASYALYTQEGEAAGLYKNPRRIGFKRQWERLIRERGYQLVDGHLTPLASVSPTASQEPATVQPVPLAAQVERHRTAINRDRLSAPLQVLARHGYLERGLSVLDFGCGKGDDVRELEAHGIDAVGWDPVYRPDANRRAADIVNLGFVLNVIEHRSERDAALREAHSLAQQVLAVSVMLGGPALRAQFTPYGDGVLTARNTFQKYYTQAQLRAYIEDTLGVSAVAAAPGIFLVFVDELEEQRFLLRRHAAPRQWRHLSGREQGQRGTPAHVLIAREPDVFEAFWQACLELGRMPEASEFEHADVLRRLAGSTAKAFDALLEAHGREAFELARSARRSDLLVYFALGFFAGRKAYRHMPQGLRHDVKAFFGRYSDALEQARALLFSIARTELIAEAGVDAHRDLGCGVLNPGHSLVIHRRYLDDLPALLRVYVGAAVALFGDLHDVDLIKIHFTSGKVSLLFYEDFQTSARPQLLRRVKIRLRDQDFDEFDHASDPKGALQDKQAYLGCAGTRSC